MGKAFHAGLEALKNGENTADAIDDCRIHFDITPPFKRAVVEMQLQIWHDKYRQDGLKYIENELEFRIDGVHGFIDGIVETPNGKKYIIEHKTTGSNIDATSFYWNRLDLNRQIDVYMWAARELGHDIEGCIYDVIKIPNYKPLKATPKNKLEYYKRDCKGGKKGELKAGLRLTNETTDEFMNRVIESLVDDRYSNLQRKTIPFLAKDVLNTMRDVRDIETLISRGLFPKNPSSCHMGRFSCDFLPVCKQETSIKNDRLYKIRTD